MLISTLHIYYDTILIYFHMEYYTRSIQMEILLPFPVPQLWHFHNSAEVVVAYKIDGSANIN